MRKGIFWYIDNKLLCFKDDIFNHKRTWGTLSRKVTGGLPYNHFPRGRVEIKRGKAVIYLNKNLCTETVIAEITKEFELTAITVEVKIDGSKHYSCYLDEECKEV